MTDKIRKGRDARGDSSGARLHPETLARGSRNGVAKLSEVAVAEIRRRYKCGGISQKALGSEYGVSQCAIWSIVTQRGWQHVTDD